MIRFVSQNDISQMAPLYDNCSSLFPNVTDRLRMIKKHEGFAEIRIQFLLERMKKFQSSMIHEKVDGLLKRTNFHKFIKDQNLRGYEGMKKPTFGLRLWQSKKCFRQSPGQWITR